MTRHALAIGLLLALLCGAASEPTTQSEPSGSIKKVKSAKGVAKSTPKLMKFQIATKQWNVRIRTEIDKSGGGLSGNIRVALMAETARDSKDQPVNWMQLEELAQGSPPHTIDKEFENGLNKDGKPKWFALSIVGNTANYDITIEDRSAPPEDSKPKKKSKKKNPDPLTDDEK
jgi:hypothetical protein